MIAFDLSTYQPGDALYLWWLGHPGTPVPIGELRMARQTKGVSLRYGEAWLQSGFPLSEDLPLLHGQVFTAGERGSAPGALDDARPDRWGERIIRHIDRPARLSILEMLLFAGDDRFGALGISTSAQQYIPRRLGPYPLLSDLIALSAAVDDRCQQTC